MTIRPAESRDVAPLLRVLAAAFRFGPDSDRFRRTEGLLRDRPQEWLVQEHDGQLTGGLHLRRDCLSVGSGRIVKGDVGEVCVLPEFQGQGLGTQLLAGAVAWMREQGYGLSRLGGKTSFYARFGYRRFPRRYLEFLVGRTVEAGASQVLEGTIVLADADRQRVRPFAPVRDGDAFRALAQRSEEPAWTRALAEAPEALPAPGPLTLVYEAAGGLAGFVQAYARGEDRNEFEGPLAIDRVLYDRDRPEVLAALLAVVNNYAVDHDIPRITARIPGDPRTLQHLAATPLHFQVIETWGGAAANLLQITSLQALLAGLLPELARRLSAAPAPPFAGVLAVDIGKDSVLLDCGGGSPHVIPSGSPDLVWRVDEIALVQMALGMLSYDEVRLAGPDHTELGAAGRALLRALFPRGLVAAGTFVG